MSKIGQIIEEFYPLIRNVPRVSGTPLEAVFIEKIADVYRAMSYDVEIQRFNFIGWELLERPRIIEVDSSKEVVAERVMWSGSTPEAGIEGVVKFRGRFRPWGLGTGYRVNKYAIVSDDGEDLGYILEDYAHGSLPTPMHDMPYISVSKADLERWMARDKPVRLYASVRTRILPGAKTANVIATKKGRKDEEIIVCAHHDTVLTDWDIIGAVDNGSGVVGVMKVAEKLMNLETEKTIRFISFAAEEFNMVGSRYYIAMRDEKDELDRIKAVINLDDVYNSFREFFIVSPNEFYKNLI
ncbi:MAG: M28 family metallopeptidase, partial [Candidatus Thorarchaeota archaeon]